MPKLELHDYQKRAINFGIKKKSVYFAIDAGLGKTAITLKIKERLKTSTPLFVVAPLRPCYTTWPTEIKKWTPQLTYSILHGPDKNWLLQLASKKPRDIYIINYEGIKWFFEQIKKGLVWKKCIMAFDEASWIKDPSTKRFKMFKKLTPIMTSYRYGLSATPAPMGYHNLWSQYYCLDEGKTLTPVYYKYRSRFFNYTGPPLYKTTLRQGSAKQIQSLIKPVTFRLEADDHLKLPRLIYNPIKIQLPPKLRKQYKDLETDFFLDVADQEITAFNAAGLSNKLRQFIQGAMYTDVGGGEYMEFHTLKVQALKELVESLAGQSLLIPIWFKFEYDLLKRAFGNDVPIIAGLTKPKDSVRLENAWNRGELPILLCHPRSVGFGLNLQTGGSNLCWCAQTWSYELFYQLIRRLRRQGQPSETVVSSHLIIEDTIDERIMQSLRIRGSNQKELLDSLKRYGREKGYYA